MAETLADTIRTTPSPYLIRGLTICGGVGRERSTASQDQLNKSWWIEDACAHSNCSQVGSRISSCILMLCYRMPFFHMQEKLCDKWDIFMITIAHQRNLMQMKVSWAKFAKQTQENKTCTVYMIFRYLHNARLSTIRILLCTCSIGVDFNCIYKHMAENY